MRARGIEKAGATSKFKCLTQPQGLTLNYTEFKVMLTQTEFHSWPLVMSLRAMTLLTGLVTTPSAGSWLRPKDSLYLFPLFPRYVANRGLTIVPVGVFVVCCCCLA